MQFGEIFAAVTEWLITNTITIALAFALLVGGWALAQFVSARIRARMARNSKVDLTVAPAVAQIARYAIYIVTVMLVLGLFGLPLATMLTVLGAAVLAIAVGLRGTLANISSGLMILTLRPMSVGDYIEGPDFVGTVVQIELFNTVLTRHDGLDIFVPNSKIWGVVITNYTRGTKRRMDIKVGISYDADIALARRVMLEIAKSDARILADPKPVVQVVELGQRAVSIQLRLWTKTADHWNVRFDLTEAVKLALDKAAIDIPHYQQFVPPNLTPVSEQQ